MKDADKATCGRCGTYRHLHPTRFGCEKPRYSFWWDRHSLARHIAGRVWLGLPEKWRWSVVSRIYARRPNLCWCDLVDCAYLDNKKDDYSGDNGCACAIPLPIDAGEPRPGWCYCAPITKGI